MKLKYIFFILYTIFFASAGKSQKINTLKTFDVEGAKQAVAVDNQYFYVIDNRAISKYNKKTGVFVTNWSDNEKLLKHLNSGIVFGDKLYCAHSNYPDCPMASSIEIFDTKTLKHIETHSLGIQYGSATWIDFHNNSWWICFANYTGRGSCNGRDNKWTILVKFDKEWHSTESWIFPADLIERFNGRSNSGGSWGNDGKLYLTGHDAAELYVVSLPERGCTLKFDYTISMGAQGQGFAFDRSISEKTIIYGIKRAESQILVMQLKKQ